MATALDAREVRRQKLYTFVCALGGDPNEVPIDSGFHHDGTSWHFERYVKNASGDPIEDECDPGRFKREVVAVASQEPWPL